MGRGQKKGSPSKKDGSFLPFLGPPPTTAKTPTLKRTKEVSPTPMDTEPPLSHKEAATAATISTPSSYAAAASINLPTEASSMEVDPPADTPAQRSSTPPRSNCSSRKQPVETAPPQATPKSTSPTSNTLGQTATPVSPAKTQAAASASPPSSSLAAALAATNTAMVPPIAVLTATATASSPLPATSTPQKAPTQTPAAKPPSQRSSKPATVQTRAKPVVLKTPPPASGLDPTLKDPASHPNKLYYDLVFVIKAQGDLDAMAIQRSYLTSFLTTIRRVDETAVLLPYGTINALNEDTLHEPDRLGQSYTAIRRYFQGFRSQKITDRMYVSVLVAYHSTPDEFYKSLRPEMENLGHNVYTRSIQAPFLSKIGWLFHSHEHTDLRRLKESLESIILQLHPKDPPIVLGFQFKNIWDGSKTPKAAFPPTAGFPATNTSGPTKRQVVRAVHVEVAQEHETEATALLHKALRTTRFKKATNLTMKLVPLFSDRLPSEEQDAIRRAITKQALCLAEFEFVSNPHINLIDEASTELHNHSLRTIVLAYRHSGKKKTFLSIDRDHNSGQVVLTYPRKYRKEANGRAHHLVKYMEYENGSPALRWFNYLGLTAASDMVWNAAEERPIPKSEAEL